MNFPQLEQAYAQSITALSRTGIITLLPPSGTPGITGIGGEPYPVPTWEQLEALMARRADLVDRKTQQGFTQFQITPLAMPAANLLERAREVLRKHAAAGTLFRTKTNPEDAGEPVQLNTAAPVWIWERVRRVLDTPEMVYFPQVYSISDHQGMTKDAVINNPQFCMAPGWSVGLIEPLPLMPQPGQGQIIGGRSQLETMASPREYLQALSAPIYQGETGWTPEDFLTHFILQLETTHQVSHDRFNANALWLLGSYMPDTQPTPHLVPVGYCASNLGRKLYLTAHRTGNHLKPCGARTMVRLGG